MGSVAALVLAPLFLALTMKRRAWRSALAMTAVAALVAAATGCGVGSKEGLQANSGTPAKVTYTVTVAATATGGQPTQTVISLSSCHRPFHMPDARRPCCS